MTRSRRPVHADSRGPKANSRATPNPSSRRWTWILLAVFGLAIGGFAVQRACRSVVPRVEPPHPDATDLPPPVAQVIHEAYEGVRQHPDSGAAWGQFGTVLLVHQFDAEATQCFEQAERLDEREFRWPYFLGVTVGVTDPDRAIEAYRRALARRSDLAVAHTRLGELLLAQRKFDEAEQEFEQALRHDPRQVRAQLGLARRHLARGNLPQARQLAEEAAKLRDDVVEVHELLAQIYYRQGDRQAADTSQARAAQHHDSHVGWDDPVVAQAMELRRDAQWSLRRAQELLDERQAFQAISVLQKALAVDDREPDLYSTLGRYLIQLGQLDDAQLTLDHGLQRHPRSSEVLFQRGVVEFLRQRYESAESYFQRTLAVRPESYLAHYNLGHTQLKLGKKSAALTAFEQSARLRPTYTDAHINAARILMDSAEGRAQAREHLQAALRFAPQDQTAQALLKTLDSK